MWTNEKEFKKILTRATKILKTQTAIIGAMRAQNLLFVRELNLRGDLQSPDINPIVRLKIKKELNEDKKTAHQGRKTPGKSDKITQTQKSCEKNHNPFLFIYFSQNFLTFGAKGYF